MMATTIVLADDHPLVRQGLRTLLEAEPAFRIVGEAGNGLEAARLAEDLRPDILVLDLMMPGLTGLEVARQITKRSPQTRIVVLSMYANEAYVMEALRNGAVGYVLKESNLTELVQAIREVAKGRRYLSPPLSERAIEEYVHKAKGAPLDRYETLTTREREVLHLVAEGHSNSEIGKRLFISPRTVEVHRANLMRKLDLHSHTDLIRYALKRGIIPPEA
jgi:two-component system, NarL family, response regulator NreC